MKKSMGAKTLIFPMPVWVVGSYDKDGKPNAMTVAYGGICCGEPPCVAVSLRKATYSHGCITARKAFTVNVATEMHVREADYFGIASGKNTDKFAVTGLTPIRSDLVDAPYIAEFPLILECRLAHTFELGLHTQFVGEIVDVKVDEAILEGDSPNIEKVKPLIYATQMRRYYGIGKHLGDGYVTGKELMK